MEEEICNECSHARTMHDQRFSLIKHGENPTGEKDGKCKIEECSCEKYTEEEK